MLVYITQCAKTTLAPITVRGLPLWYLGVGGGFFARRRAAAYLRRLYASGIRRGVFEEGCPVLHPQVYGVDPAVVKEAGGVLRRGAGGPEAQGLPEAEQAGENQGQ